MFKDDWHLMSEKSIKAFRRYEMLYLCSLEIGEDVQIFRKNWRCRINFTGFFRLS